MKLINILILEDDSDTAKDYLEIIKEVFLDEPYDYNVSRFSTLEEVFEFMNGPNQDPLHIGIIDLLLETHKIYLAEIRPPNEVFGGYSFLDKFASRFDRPIFLSASNSRKDYENDIKQRFPEIPVLTKSDTVPEWQSTASNLESPENFGYPENLERFLKSYLEELSNE